MSDHADPVPGGGSAGAVDDEMGDGGGGGGDGDGDGVGGDEGEMSVHEHLDMLALDSPSPDLLEDDYVLGLLDGLVEHYRSAQDADNAQVIEAGAHLLLLDTSADLSTDNVNSAFDRASARIYALYLAAKGRGLVGGAEMEQQSTERSLALCLVTARRVRDALRSLASLTTFIRQPDAASGTVDFRELRYQNAEDLDNFQTLIIFLCGEFSTRGLRRHRGLAYCQIMSEAGIATHAWRPVPFCNGDIAALIYSIITRRNHYDQWLQFTHTKGFDTRLVEYFTRAKEEEFAELQPNRHHYSFVNGVFDNDSLTFYPYGDRAFPPNVVACVYHPVEFDAEALFAHGDWYDVPTPIFQRVMDYQGLPVSVQRMLCASLGRTLFGVNEKDRKQYALFIKGVAQSGKSTIADFLTMLINKCDIGTISSGMEGTFGIESLVDTLMNVCREAKRNLCEGNTGLAQDVLQSMITGEAVKVPRKFKTALTVEWTVPSIFFGNEGFGRDAAGSLVRRMLMFLFLKKVKHSDPTMYEKFRDTEIANFLYKISAAYAEMLHISADKDITDTIAAYGEEAVEYFKNSSEDMKESCSPLHAFIHSSPRLRVEAGTYMPYDIFKDMFGQYCKGAGHRFITLTRDVVDSVFSDFDIRVEERATREFEGKHSVNTWLLGVTVEDSPEYIDAGAA
jgi:phage/plasmid-associated DNA primase